MPTDFIIDFETLGVRDNAVLLSIGVLACPSIEDYNKFTIEELMKKGLHLKINRKQQIEMGRVIDKSTIEWWKNQSKEAQEILSNENLIDIVDVYKKVYDYFIDNGFKKGSKIWSRGMIDQRWWSSFCETICKKQNIEYYDPFIFNIWRDTRTLLDLLTGSTEGAYDFKDDEIIIKHNALYDCVVDYIKISNALMS